MLPEFVVDTCTFIVDFQAGTVFLSLIVCSFCALIALDLCKTFSAFLTTFQLFVHHPRLVIEHWWHSVHSLVNKGRFTRSNFACRSYRSVLARWRFSRASLRAYVP